MVKVNSYIRGDQRNNFYIDLGNNFFFTHDVFVQLLMMFFRDLDLGTFDATLIVTNEPYIEFEPKVDDFYILL